MEDLNEDEKHDATNFFSVSSKYIVVGAPLAYDLFINSSGDDHRQRFVKIFKKDRVISEQDVEELRRKYHQLYVAEKERTNYLQSLTRSDRFSDVEKSEVIKEAAIQHLDDLFNPDTEFTTEVLNETIEGCRGTVAAMVDVVHGFDVSSLQKHIASLSYHDFYTYDHSINVSMYCITLLKALVPTATNDELITAGLGGLLHDIGKIRIPTYLLNKTGKLSDEEFDKIRAHPNTGMGILCENGVEAPQGVNLEIVKRVVYEHHENFNGSGYPNQTKGESIHLLARIAAIADFFDAITTKRSYHEALPIEEALSLMEKSKGKKLDPKLFELFMKHVHQMKKAKDMHQRLPDNFDPCMPHDHLPIKKDNVHQLDPNKKRKHFDMGEFRSAMGGSKIIKGKK